MPTHSLYRYAAFTTHPSGGNPAGVWIGDVMPIESEMQRIAAEVGFSETAFMVPQSGNCYAVRYFSPKAEVSFCGHATIACGVMLGEQTGDGVFRLATSVGDVPVDVRLHNGIRMASLTSVPPRQVPASSELRDSVLAALHWESSELDPTIPPVRAYAGAWHLVLAARTHERLRDLTYNFNALNALMIADGLTTIQLVWRESEFVYHSRNPFPVGGVVEDPATGASAAALGGYLRDAALVSTPSAIVIHQGLEIGRPSRIKVDIPLDGGIVVTGAAVQL